jgi:protein tyrosine/serine phosphatase
LNYRGMLAGKGIILALLMALAIGILAAWIWRQYFDTYHLAVVQDGVLYRDGVRSAGQFAAALRKVRPKTIVCLVDDQEIAQEPFMGEADVCRQNGIDLVRIPIRLGGWPTSEQVREFLDIVADPTKRPVLVHCAQGVRRTGMMVAAYQESVLHLNRDQAKAALLSFGHSDRTVKDVKRFIDNYDPSERRLTEDLPMSQE